MFTVVFTRASRRLCGILGKYSFVGPLAILTIWLKRVQNAWAHWDVLIYQRRFGITVKRHLRTYSPSGACEGASSSSGTLSSCSSLGTISSLCLWPKASAPDYSTSLTLWSLTTHGSLEPVCVETIRLTMPVQLPGPLTEGWLHYIIHDVHRPSSCPGTLASRDNL